MSPRRLVTTFVFFRLFVENGTSDIIRILLKLESILREGVLVATAKR